MARPELELYREIKTVLDMYSESIVQQVQTEWARIGNQPNLQGNAEVKKRVKKIAQGVILMEITGSGQKALLMEFGKGSKMDMVTNPNLADYMAWSGFNKARFAQEMVTLSRKPGSSVTDLDGNTYTSQARNEGINLENKNPKFKPEEAHHVIRNIVCGLDGERGMLSAILNDIGEAVVLYDFFKNMPKQIKI